LLPPPLVTIANSREASVFSIFLLMMLPQPINRSSVHLPCEADVHLPCEADVHLSSLSLHVVLQWAKGSATTCR
jgi:hypothetical protein